MENSTRIVIEDASQTGDARRRAGQLAAGEGLGEELAGRYALLATEAATNILKHAQRGELILRRILPPFGRGVELLALDRGPGMSDLQRCLEDGYSTAGSSGTGLGAMQRMAHQFDVYTRPGKGTVVMARLWAERPPGHALELGVVNLPHPREARSGDGWSACGTGPDQFALMVSDGLGHGSAARSASEAACASFNDGCRLPPDRLLEAMNQAVRPTRGAAVAVAQVDLRHERLSYAGVGNIDTRLIGAAGSRALISRAGIVGHEFRVPQVQQESWPLEAMLIMHSDGLTTRWRLQDYPGLFQRHAALIAAVLYRDHARGPDDVTVLVARHRKEQL